MSKRKTSKDTRNATSSQESVAGVSHCGLPTGPMTDLFGLEAPPASHSLRPLGSSKKPNQMSVTYGRILQGSSASGALQSCLVNKLMTRLPTAGWMTPFMTWKFPRTPALRRYCRLAARMPTPEESEFSLWRTPVSTDNRNRGNAQQAMQRLIDGKTINLSMQIKMVTSGLPVTTVGKGELNPAFVCSLIGFLPTWEDCAPTVMRLTRASPQNLSKR